MVYLVRRKDTESLNSMRNTSNLVEGCKIGKTKVRTLYRISNNTSKKES